MGLKKVAIDTRELAGRGFGIARFVGGLIRELAGRKLPFEIVPVLARGMSSDLFDSFEEPVILSRAGGNFKEEHIDLPRQLHTRGIDLFFSPFYKVPVRGNFLKMGTIYDLTVLYPDSGYNWLKRVMYRNLLRFFARKMDKIFTVSNYSKEEIVSRLRTREGKIKVIPVAPDPEFFREGRKIEKPERDILLFVSRVLPHKNVPFLLDVYRTLPAPVRGKFSLVITGEIDITYRERLEREVSVKGIPSGRVIFRDYVSDKELLDLYDRAYLFLFPSLREGFGVPVVEAMARGVPVLVSDRTSLPEVVGDAGTVLPLEDPSTWAGEIKGLLDDSARWSDMAERGKRRARDFSRDRVGDIFVREVMAALNGEEKGISSVPR